MEACNGCGGKFATHSGHFVRSEVGAEWVFICEGCDE